jgi:hypothetical protein
MGTATSAAAAAPTEQTVPAVAQTTGQPQSTALTKFYYDVVLPDNFKASFIDGFGEVSYDDTNIKFLPVLFRTQVVELNSREIPNKKDHLGEFYFQDFGVEEEDHYAKTLNVIPIGILGEKRYLYLGQYNPNAEKKEADCYSKDGVTPAPKAKNHFADLCSKCEYGVWVDGQKPKCTNIKEVLLFDIDRKIFIQYSFKGTGMSAWNKIYRKIKSLMGTSYITGKPTTGLYITMSTTDKGLYHQLEIEMGQKKDDLTPEKYVYFIQYFVSQVLPTILRTTNNMEDTEDVTVTPGLEAESAIWQDQTNQKALADLPF